MVCGVAWNTIHVAGPADSGPVTTPGGYFRKSNAEIDRQAAMDALADRQEGRAVGMVRFVAARTLDHGSQGNDNAEQQNPEGKQPGHDPRRRLQFECNQQSGHVNQNNPPEQPAAAADLFQPCHDGNAF